MRYGRGTGSELSNNGGLSPMIYELRRSITACPGPLSPAMTKRFLVVYSVTMKFGR